MKPNNKSREDFDRAHSQNNKINVSARVHGVHG